VTGRAVSEVTEVVQVSEVSRQIRETIRETRPTDASGAGAQPRPHRPRFTARSMYRIQRLVRPNGLYRRFAARLESVPLLRRLFTEAEEKVKADLFGCRMCGQCALPVTGYACPMSCPKQMRNGPCGGVGSDGACEVYPELRCVWLEAYDRAAGQGRAADLSRLQRPIDHRIWGQSSWVNYWQGRDEGLWTDRLWTEDDDGALTVPDIQPDLVVSDR
jgi:hypothetical protein